MLLVALLIGVILIVAAIRNSQGALFTALATDVPGFVVWAAAIVGVGAIGFIPGLKPASRGLLALVIVVLLVNNYQAIIAGFQGANKAATNAGQGSQGSGASASGGASGAASGSSGSGGSNPVGQALALFNQGQTIYGQAQDAIASGAAYLTGAH
jgi:uncharacterized membrane protein YgcG